MKINSILDEEADWFHSRVKCFSLYTLLLAVNHTNIDVLSLGCQGQELEVKCFSSFFDLFNVESLSDPPNTAMEKSPNQYGLPPPQSSL